MNNTLKYILKRYQVGPIASLPVDLPKVGRSELAYLFAKLRFTKGAIIGTWQGTYPAVLAKKNPELNLIAVDVTGATPKKLLPSQTKVLRMDSVEAAKKVVDGSLDFVYLDGDGDLASSTADLAAWIPKVRSGGIIAGHDFKRYLLKNNMHAFEAVTAYTTAYRVTPWFVVGRETDSIRSYFWVKA